MNLKKQYKLLLSKTQYQKHKRINIANEVIFIIGTKNYLIQSPLANLRTLFPQQKCITKQKAFCCFRRF